MECQTKFFTNFKSDQMWKNEIFLTTFPVNEFSCNIWTHISFHIRMHIKWNAHHFLIPFRRLNAVLFWWPFIFRVQSFSQALCCNFSLSGVLFLLFFCHCDETVSSFIPLELSKNLLILLSESLNHLCVN